MRRRSPARGRSSSDDCRLHSLEIRAARYRGLQLRFCTVCFRSAGLPSLRSGACPRCKASIPFLTYSPTISASRCQAIMLCHSVRSCHSSLRSLNRSLVARLSLATGVPLGVYFTSGSCPTLPTSITLFTLFGMRAPPNGAEGFLWLKYSIGDLQGKMRRELQKSNCLLARGVRESRASGLLQGLLDCSATLLTSEIAEPNEVRAILRRQEKKLLVIDRVSRITRPSRKLKPGD